MTSELKLEVINAFNKGYTIDQILESLNNISYEEIEKIIDEIEKKEESIVK